MNVLSYTIKHACPAGVFEKYSQTCDFFDAASIGAWGDDALASRGILRDRSSRLRRSLSRTTEMARESA
jgi:hypothetical protein